MLKTNGINLINTNSPRDSRVFADGNYVIKNPVAINSAHIKVWIERQTHARAVIDSLLDRIPNTKYFIPKIVEISEQPVAHVREERVYGQPITAGYFATLLPQQKDRIYNSLAQFINDMNQSYPVLDIISQFEDDSLILNSLKSILSDKEITTIKNAYNLLKQHPEKTSSFVFFHGDMNENNIFFDEQTNTVSIIDFTEARYESAYYMFHSDLSRLTWLDLDKLMAIYNQIPKKTPVRTGQDKSVMEVFNNLRTIQNTAKSFLNRPQNAEIYKKILKEAIVSLDKAYNTVINTINLMNLSVKSRI